MAPRRNGSILRETLTADQVRSILHYDPATGIFTWKKREDRDDWWNRRWAGTRAGALCKGYIYITIQNPTRYMAHRLAWLYMKGEWPKHEVDHIDRNRQNNRWDNLRAATRMQNVWNSSAMHNSVTGIRGVSYDKARDKFDARLQHGGKVIWRERYDTLEEAKKGRQDAALKLHGEFASRDG